MNRDKQMINDLIEIFDEEYSKRNLITPHNTAVKMTEKGYRKAEDVAREIFEEIEKALNRKIARSKPQFEKLHRDEKDLSIWGYKDMGYFQGIISTCEDFQDIIDELKKEYTESEKEITEGEG